MTARVVYACDIGTTRSNPPNFGWARAVPTAPQDIVGSRRIDELAALLKRDMAAGLSVAIGFESPLFLPVPVTSESLSLGRDGEGNRAWSAPAGSAVTTLGVHQAAWILREIYQAAGDSYVFSADWKRWPGSTRPLLLCWEALVCREAHSPTNDPTEDAATALVEFLASEANLDAANAIAAYPRLSLIHAIALWSGWSKDIAGLHESALVIQPANAFRGEVRPAVPSDDPNAAGPPVAPSENRQGAQAHPGLTPSSPVPPAPASLTMHTIAEELQKAIETGELADLGPLVPAPGSLADLARKTIIAQIRRMGLYKEQQKSLQKEIQASMMMGKYDEELVKQANAKLRLAKELFEELKMIGGAAEAAGSDFRAIVDVNRSINKDAQKRSKR